MAVSREKKILRIGLIQNGKILVERLLRRREAVTIGQSPRNTFEISSGDLPKSFTLFELKGENYVLNFNHSMNGKLSIKRSVLDFRSLREQKLAQKSGDVYSVELANENRGKVVIGDVVVLFQFVEPPPPPSKLQLPVALRRGVLQRLEWPFVSSVLASFGVQVIFWGYVLTQEYPVDPQEVTTIDDRFVSAIAPKKEEPPEIELKDEDDESDKDKDKEEEKPVPKPKPKPVVVPKAEPKPVKPKRELSVKEKAKVEQKQKQKIGEAIKDSAVIRTVGSLFGPGSQKDTGDDGAEMAATEAAYEGTTTVRDARKGDPSKTRRNLASKLRGKSGVMKGSGTGKLAVKTKKPEKRKRKKLKSFAAVTPSRVSGQGKVDAGSMRGAIRRRAGCVKRCYDRRLKQNPSLKGKLRLRLTINEQGKCAGISVIQNSTSDQAVQRCILRCFRSARYPKPKGGTARVTVPILLSAKN